MVAAIINEGRQAFVINLRLHVVDLRYGSRQCHKGARLSDVASMGPREVVGVIAGTKRGFCLFAGRRSLLLVSQALRLLLIFASSGYI
jgi:hypothetical protein